MVVLSVVAASEAVVAADAVAIAPAAVVAVDVAAGHFSTLDWCCGGYCRTASHRIVRSQPSASVAIISSSLLACQGSFDPLRIAAHNPSGRPSSVATPACSLRPNPRGISPCRATWKIEAKSVAAAPAQPSFQHGSRDHHRTVRIWGFSSPRSPGSPGWPGARRVGVRRAGAVGWGSQEWGRAGWSHKGWERAKHFAFFPPLLSHVRFLLLLCETGRPTSPDDPAEPERTIWVVHGRDPRQQFNEKTPERKKRANMRRREGKREILGCPAEGPGEGGPGEGVLKKNKTRNKEQGTKKRHENKRGLKGVPPETALEMFFFF